MASGGRGRGRGRGAMIYASEPRPGGDNSAAPSGNEKVTEVDGLSSMVNSLALSAGDGELMPVVDTVTKMASAAQPSQEEVVMATYKRCQLDWRFSPTAAKLYNKIADLEGGEGGPKFRQTLLKTLQGDFKDKDKLRRENPTGFLGCISLLTQTLCHVRLQDGEPFKPLASPVIDGLETCLDNRASSEELECAADQLLDVGIVLSELADFMKLQRLRNNVKDRIAAGQGSRETRLKLINIIEGFASNWQLHTPTLKS